MLFLLFCSAERDVLDKRLQSAEALNVRLTSDISKAEDRVREVEDEMRDLLMMLENQKAASAAKIKQLTSVLGDLQAALVST